MSRREIIAKIDNVLKPRGFVRRNVVWNRRSENLVQVVDIQISKAGDIVTVNAGVLDRETYPKIWGTEAPEMIQEPACPVRARIGELISGADTWWRLDDSQTADKLAEGISSYVLPFLDRAGSRQSMVKWLMDKGDAVKRDPLALVHLAVLQHLLGQTATACGVLDALQKNALGRWRAKAGEVAKRLGCVQADGV